MYSSYSLCTPNAHYVTVNLLERSLKLMAPFCIRCSQKMGSQLTLHLNNGIGRGGWDGSLLRDVVCSTMKVFLLLTSTTPCYLRLLDNVKITAVMVRGGC
ncbi:hypothetical protein TNIN_7141 [Trichonephila inaurata madagascariensis]|uniref:Uncharacterized protein n=1 Tax=Trichonephila inaurata madagascariensis TaxID=2747483 RepID=A0A8X6YPT9_9ARAC|nr:hypothetical protein TNIN_7141 [Trichonephila inaurata madagascariensis]